VNGEATFDTLGAIDGLTGCYRLVFFHLSFNTVIFSDPSEPICIRNSDTYATACFLCVANALLEMLGVACVWCGTDTRSLRIRAL